MWMFDTWVFALFASAFLTVQKGFIVFEVAKGISLETDFYSSSPWLYFLNENKKSGNNYSTAQSFTPPTSIHLFSVHYVKSYHST